MGRKRNQGKARRAKAKARQETEERGNNNQITSREKHPQVEQLRTRQFQFQIGNRDCSHGLENFDFDMSPEFVKKFVEAFHEARDKDDKVLRNALWQLKMLRWMNLPMCGTILPRWNW